MTARGARGYTLLEFLAATALFGLIVMTAVTLTTDLTRDARAAEREDDAFRRREVELMRFRAAARRASAARQQGACVVLSGDGPAAAWCLDGCTLRVQPRPRGTIVRIGAAWGEESVLVGGLAP